jgi:hypothetical protein
VQVLIQPIGQLRGDGANRTHRIRNRLKVAHVKAVQLVPSHREVDDGWLLRIDVNRVVVVVLLGRHWSSVLDCDHLKEELWGRRPWKRRRRRWRDLWRRRRRERRQWRRLGRWRVLRLWSERWRHSGWRSMWRCARERRHDRHAVRPRGRRRGGWRTRRWLQRRRERWRGHVRWRTGRRRRGWRVSWRRWWPWRHRLRDGGDVNKRRNHVVFPTAQEVFTLRKGVRSMEVLVQKAGQLWRNGPYRACLVGR